MTPIFAGVAVELGLIIGWLWLRTLLRALSDADVTVGSCLTIQIIKLLPDYSNYPVIHIACGYVTKNTSTLQHKSMAY